MKRLIFLFILTSIYSLTYSQTNVDDEKNTSKNMFGIFSNIGICQPFRFQHVISDVSSHGKTSFSLGVKYKTQINNKYKFEIDTRFSKYQIENKLLDYPIPGKISESFNVISIPLMLQRYYEKKYFLSIGPILDFGLSRKNRYVITDTQSGIGLKLGAGKEFSINNFSIDLVPELEIHSLLPFHSEKYQQRLAFLSFNIGLNYSF